MFQLFSRQTRKSHPAPRTARPRLESLEGRLVPATVTLNPITYGTGRQVTLSGTLSNTGNVAWQMIALGGQVSGTTMTNAQGQFSATLTASALGNVTAALSGDSAS